MNQHNMCFLMAQLQPSTTIPIPPALPSMDQSDNECFSHHACPTEPPPKPSEADRNVTIASKDETRQTAVSPTIHPDASVNIPGPATPSTARPACYDTYSVLLTVVWLRYLPDYLPPRKRRHRCRVHCRRHQHARHCFGGVDQTAEEGMDLDDVTEKDGDMVEQLDGLIDNGTTNGSDGAGTTRMPTKQHTATDKRSNEMKEDACYIEHTR
ncbi:hypothetical protein NCU12077 [Neurospora crassa OR74A]|uniref:Uncharacterized protein n=1 Tax=Neurospora crassa (strain ATCC 24698 / 74-OR23-1A / CBS 708.71 / DSM 1257 / FGSC 987) TaxID=367110 RepID=V5IN00_NEUCR|nr:hypothetical protein NCU12077 [Neurospora crassa OR74A]ESA42116.1 hypothetical protein NCU12077 [Neurospora crassa OR74A]|eukprot:XP_011395038.1 hypothetical protein NCU12077 [Neurospora crassa OR74A]